MLIRSERYDRRDGTFGLALCCSFAASHSICCDLALGFRILGVKIRCLLSYGRRVLLAIYQLLVVSRAAKYG